MSRAGIARLAKIADKPERRIIGLMSGTSLDGLDIALCRLSGSGFQTRFDLERFVTIPYGDGFRRMVLECFARRAADLEALTLLNVQVAEHHADLVNSALAQWNLAADEVDLLASHGQTIYHAPRSLHGRSDAPNATLQLGDGDHMAVRTGVITCSDFRQKHIAAGGEGAPLASYGDLLLLGDKDTDRLLLNIGGIANFTYLPPTSDRGEAFSSDIGPGNTLMDAYVRAHAAPLQYDEDGKLARSGSVDEPLLAKMLRDPFLSLPFPKTTGPEHFSLARFEALAEEAAPGLGAADALATLNRFSAQSIADAIGSVAPRAEVFVSGGGAHNPVLRRHLEELLPDQPIKDTNALGLDPDAKEAVLFALLANELVAGDPHTFRGRIMGGPPVTMGKISLPN